MRPKSFKPLEDTHLERRVLAHERVLAVLITELARDRPDLLLRLQEVFSPHPPLARTSRNTPTRPVTPTSPARRLWDAWDRRRLG